jgi:hypothetical protein
MQRDFEERLAELHVDLGNIAALINAREQELEKLRHQRGQLGDKVRQLEILRDEVAELGLSELVRMCNTPVVLYKPRVVRFVKGLAKAVLV